MSKEPYRAVISSRSYDDYLKGTCARFQSCGMLRFGGFTFYINFKTDSSVLMDMWKMNFPQTNNPEQLHGTVEVYGGNGQYGVFRDQSNPRILVINKRYYGSVKLGYRALCSYLMDAKDLWMLSMHSAGGVIDNKLFLVTGASGSGKNTILTYLDGKYDCQFLWDDWGVVDSQGKVFPTSETAYHMSGQSALSFAPILKESGGLESSKLMCEDEKSKKYMVPLHDLRKTFANSFDIFKCNGGMPVNTLFILTNHAGQNGIKKVDSSEARRVFSMPSYSYAWDCMVPYKNEHLVLTSAELEILSLSYGQTFSKIPNIFIVNNNKQEVDKTALLDSVDKALME